MGRPPHCAPPPEPAPAEPVPLQPRVYIDVSNDKAVSLYDVTGEAVGVGSADTVYAMAYRSVCDSPCGRPVAIQPATDYFIGGDRVTASKRIRLDEGRDTT